jgi:REP element-mobilizing transposase RayT
MSEIIHKQHKVNTLMYHIVCPAKYRRAAITKEADGKLREICLGIVEARYEIKFLETGPEKDHAHFLVQPGGGGASVPPREDSADDKKSNGKENI